MEEHINPMDEVIARQKEAAVIADGLIKADPNLPSLTAFIIAQDQQSVVNIERSMGEGTPWQKAIWLAGSYARLDWLKGQMKSGAISQEEVYPHLPKLWSGSDPDDTDVFWFGVWADAWRENGEATIQDEPDKPLPNHDGVKGVKVYRGQPAEANPGLSWSTDLKVAQKFAAYGGGRFPRKDGIVYESWADPTLILAYLTGRGESEVVISPFSLR